MEGSGRRSRGRKGEYQYTFTFVHLLHLHHLGPAASHAWPLPSSSFKFFSSCRNLLWQFWSRDEGERTEVGRG